MESILTVTRYLAESDELWMFVVLERGGHPLDEMLRQALVRELAFVSGVTEEDCRVFELSDLPVTRRGKVMGSELERLINHQALPNRARMKNPEIIGEIVRAIHTEVLGFRHKA